MRRRKNAGSKNRFQLQEALSEVVAESRCITVPQPVNTKALTLAGFGGVLLQSIMRWLRVLSLTAEMLLF
jgi:hypothetical protein